jgi:hypothetical protein
MIDTPYAIVTLFALLLWFIARSLLNKRFNPTGGPLTKTYWMARTAFLGFILLVLIPIFFFTTGGSALEDNRIPFLVLALFVISLVLIAWLVILRKRNG